MEGEGWKLSGCLQWLPLQILQLLVMALDIGKCIGQREEKPGLAVVEQKVVRRFGQVDMVHSDRIAL